MFDFVKYAREHGVAIAIDPFGEITVVTVSTAVESGYTYTTLDCCVRAGLEEGKERQVLDSCLARIKGKDDKHEKNVEKSRHRAEMEKFWRNR